MIKNYIKIAWRNLNRSKVQSVINIAGLAMGMVACLLILQYISFEFSFDHFNNNAKDIYRVNNDRYQNGKLIQHGTITYSGVGKAMQSEYPEILRTTRVEPFSQQVISSRNNKTGDLNGIAVDNTFLSMFSYPFVAGDKQNGLKEPNSVILSASVATKLFRNRNRNYQNIIGQTILISRNPTPFKITAVCADVPENSHLSFDFLISYNSLYAGKNGFWKQADYDFTASDFWHYIQLKPGADYKALEAKFGGFSKKYFQGTKVSGSEERFFLQPLLKTRLYSDFEYEIGRIGNATTVWSLLTVAILIICIAWINYVNLSTAKSLERAKEVGIRKVTGATKAQLIGQFLTESFLLNVLALGIALMVIYFIQQPFNNLVQHQLSLKNLFNTGVNGFGIALPLAAFLLLGMLASGFYPAFVLSAFKPVLVLKGKFTTSGKGILLRKVLVVGQFAVTVALIISSIILYKQVRYMNRQNLGIDLTKMLVIKAPVLTNWDSTFIDRENAFKNELKQIAHVKGASVTGRTAGDELSRMFNVHRTDKNMAEKLTMRNMSVDADFIQVYGVKVLAGRNFDAKDYNADPNKLHNLVVNESAVKLLGYTSNEDAIGKSIRFGTGDKDWDIIGVINDYHQKSLRYAIEPLVLAPSYGTDNPISIKVDTKDLAATIASVKEKYNAFFPNNFFDYYFLDEKFNNQYKNDQLFEKVFGIFSGLAIFVASLGLLGLSLFTTAQRTKEIGVRKILGASVSSIIVLLSKDFIRLVLLAIVIGTPIAYFIMQKWLQGFVYRTSVPVWVYISAATLAVFIALITISFQAVKASVANPVKSLRSE